LITAPYWAEVLVNGKKVPKTTPMDLTLPAGVSHRIVVRHPPKGLEETFRVKLKNGQTLRRKITFKN
jgi:hypothetical protein